MIKHYPIKVMYLRDMENPEEDSKRNSNNSSNSITTNSNSYLPKAEIPLIYKHIFEKIYPNVQIEDEATNKELFTVDVKKLLLFNPKDN